MKNLNDTAELQIKFHGFHPSEFTREYLTYLLRELHEEAPYGATLDASFSRDNHVFKGMITIHSSVGKFFAASADTRLKEAGKKLTAQIRKRLDKWKTLRFKKRRNFLEHHTSVA